MHSHRIPSCLLKLKNSVADQKVNLKSVVSVDCQPLMSYAREAINLGNRTIGSLALPWFVRSTFTPEPLQTESFWLQSPSRHSILS